MSDLTENMILLKDYKKHWLNKMPHHVSIILDGNRRYAEKKNIPLGSGHLFGLFGAMQTVQNLFSFGVEEVTVFAWAITNFKRSEFEKNTIYSIFNLLPIILGNNYGDYFKRMRIQFKIAGNLDLFPVETRIALSSLEKLSSNDPKRFFNFCVSYGFKDELWKAYLKADERHEKIKDINEILDELNIKNDVDLFIRPGKEIRDSGFLPLQAAQAEKYYIQKFLPEITRNDVEDILTDYIRRDRRMGGGNPQKMLEAKNILTSDMKKLSPTIWNHLRSTLDDVRKWIDFLYRYTDI